MMSLIEAVIGIGLIAGLLITVRALDSWGYARRLIGLFIIGVGVVALLNIAVAMISVGVVLLMASLREIVLVIRERQSIQRSE